MCLGHWVMAPSRRTTGLALEERVAADLGEAPSRLKKSMNQNTKNTLAYLGQGKWSRVTQSPGRAMVSELTLVRNDVCEGP